MGTKHIATIANQYVVFRLDQQQYALHLTAVERIVRAVAITPLPSPGGTAHLPAEVLGVVNVQGRVIPVVSLRKLYGLAERDLQVSDQFIIASASKSTVALVVDAVVGVDSCDEREVIAGGTVIPGLEGISAIARNRDEIIILHDLDHVPDLEDVALPEVALTESGSA